MEMKTRMSNTNKLVIFQSHLIISSDFTQCHVIKKGNVITVKVCGPEALKCVVSILIYNKTVGQDIKNNECHCQCSLSLQCRTGIASSLCNVFNIPTLMCVLPETTLWQAFTSTTYLANRFTYTSLFIKPVARPHCSLGFAVLIESRTWSAACSSLYLRELSFNAIFT